MDDSLPPGVTNRMIEDHFGGPEDEGVEIDLAGSGDTLIAVQLIGDQIFLTEILIADGDVLNEFVFDLPQARLLASAISERVM